MIGLAVLALSHRLAFSNVTISINDSQARCKTMTDTTPVKVTSNDLIIEVATGRYPVALEVIRLKHTDRSFAMQPHLEDLQALGYEVVEPTIRPEGNVVTEGAPELVDGVWLRTWEVREWNADEVAAQLAQAKAELSGQVMNTRNDDFEMGITYSPEVGVEFNVQLRPEDRVNLVMLSLQAKAALAIEDETLEKFRSYENETFELTPAQVIDMTNKALVGIKSIYQQSWDFKDQIDSAVKTADLPVLPSTFILAD